jgi:hypothetical protein
LSASPRRWRLVDIRSGHLLVERCHHCGARNSYFSTDPGGPAEEHREGVHYWHPLLRAQAVVFNLRDEQSGEVVDLGDMTALMLSTCEDPSCAVGRLALEHGRGTSIYVALCGDSTHASGRCVSDAGIAALNEYFNQPPRSARRRIVVVPCMMCNNVDHCPGVVIADTGLIDLWEAR